MVHLAGVRGTKRKDQENNEGNFFTISGMKYGKAAAKKENISKVVHKSIFRVKNDTCKECR